VCFEFLCNFYPKCFSFYEEMSDIWSAMYIGFRVKYPLFSSDFIESWIFSTDFRKILKCQILWKSVPWEPSCSIRTVGRTDMTKLIVFFRNFAKAPKMSIQNVFYKKLCKLTKVKFCMKLKTQIGRKKTNLQIWGWMQFMKTDFMVSDIQECCRLP
jgi:hypothetical protein